MIHIQIYDKDNRYVKGRSYRHKSTKSQRILRIRRTPDIKRFLSLLGFFLVSIYVSFAFFGELFLKVPLFQII